MSATENTKVPNTCTLAGLGASAALGEVLPHRSWVSDAGGAAALHGRPCDARVAAALWDTFQVYVTTVSPVTADERGWVGSSGLLTGSMTTSQERRERLETDFWTASETESPGARSLDAFTNKMSEPSRVFS